MNCGKTLAKESSGLRLVTARSSMRIGKMKDFEIPGATMEGALLHFARAVCRRAESVVTGVPGAPGCSAYLNALSDLLFVMAVKADRMDKTGRCGKKLCGMH